MLFQNTAFQKNAHKPVSQKKPLYPDQKHNSFLVHKREKYMMQMKEYCYICVFVEKSAAILLQYSYGTCFGPRTGVCVGKFEQMSVSSMNNHCPLVR